MKPLRNFMLSLTALIVLGNFWLPGGYPHPLYDRDPFVDLTYKDEIQAYQPDVFFIGNSLIGRWLDFSYIEELSGLRILKAEIGGSQSAIWYLVFKNVVSVAEPPPRYVVIVFKDNAFSVPGDSVLGKYQKVVNQYAGPDEPVLDQLAYLNYITPVEYWLSEAVSYYRYHDDLKTDITGAIKYPALTALFGSNYHEVDAAVDSVFSPENLDSSLYTLAQERDDVISQQLYGSYDFYGSLDSTFLPYLLEIAEERGIKLIFVRYKARHYVDFPENEPQMEAYFDDMESYLSERGAYFVDFSHDPRIQIEHYSDGDHMNGEGIVVLAQMLAEALNGIVVPAK